MATEPLDPTDLRAQEKATKDRQDREAETQRIEAEDLKWIMADKRGRRFMHALLGVTGVFRNPFTGNSETFFRCGEMNVGQRYLAAIHENCPERYSKMIEEHRDDNRKR